MNSMVFAAHATYWPGTLTYILMSAVTARPSPQAIFWPLPLLYSFLLPLLSVSPGGAPYPAILRWLFSILRSKIVIVQEVPPSWSWPRWYSVRFRYFRTIG